MSSPTMNMTELETLVFKAFQGQSGRQRTVGGVARDTGLTNNIVEDVLKRNPDKFEPSPMSPPGSPVYRIIAPETEN